MSIPTWKKDGVNCAPGGGEAVRYGRRASDLSAAAQLLVTSGDYILKLDDRVPDSQAPHSAEVIRLFPPGPRAADRRSRADPA